MKRKLSTLLMTMTICLCATNLIAQGLYLSINGGAGFSMSSQNLPSLANVTKTYATSTEEQIHLSLGKGLNYGGAAGYMFNKNIGVELGLSFLNSDKTNYRNSSTVGSISGSYSANMMRIIPTIIITAGLDKINPYAKFGAVFGTGCINYSAKETQGANVFAFNVKMDGANAFGISACIGTLYKLNKQISLFAEITTINLSYAPTKGNVNSATFNGVDELSSLTTKVKEINFVESFTTTNNATAPDSQPSTSLIQKYPFGSIGLNVGLKYSL